MIKSKKILVAGSIAAALLMAGAQSANIVGQTTDTLIESRSSERALVSQDDLNTTGELTSGKFDSDIFFFSNFPDYTANGFNMSTYQAVVAYANANLLTPADFGYKNTAAYDDTGESYVAEIATIYDAMSTDTKTIITSGFQVANTYMGKDYSDLTYVGFDGLWGKADENGVVEGHEDEYIVLLDDNLLGQYYQNAVSVQFAAEGAGYLAGLGAAAYTIGIQANDDDYSDDIQNIVMWGGIGYPTVYSYMSGFAQAIEQVNAAYPSMSHITLWSGGDNSDKAISAENTYGTSTGTDTWYTGGFDGAGDSEDAKLATTKTQNALAAGASVVFPIAGGNTGVALDEVSKAPTGSKTKVMGVDTDNTIDYKDQSEYILGSATKSLVLGGYLGLSAVEHTAAADSDVLETIHAWEGDNPEASKGIILTGTIENGGVGFTFENADNGEGVAGINIDMVDAMMNLGMDDASDLQAWMDKMSEDVTVNAADNAFVPEEVSNPDNGPNLTWLWIVLGVILAISIIGIIVFFVLKALKKEE